MTQSKSIPHEPEGYRTAAHCIEYVHQVLWEKKKGQESFDADNAEHMEWMYQEAKSRAEVYGIPVRILPSWELSKKVWC